MDILELKQQVHAAESGFGKLEMAAHKALDAYVYNPNFDNWDSLDAMMKYIFVAKRELIRLSNKYNAQLDAELKDWANKRLND